MYAIGCDSKFVPLFISYNRQYQCNTFKLVRWDGGAVICHWPYELFDITYLRCGIRYTFGILCAAQRTLTQFCFRKNLYFAIFIIKLRFGLFIEHFVTEFFSWNV